MKTHQRGIPVSRESLRRRGLNNNNLTVVQIFAYIWLNHAWVNHSCLKHKNRCLPNLRALIPFDQTTCSALPDFVVRTRRDLHHSSHPGGVVERNGGCNHMARPTRRVAVGAFFAPDPRNGRWMAVDAGGAEVIVELSQ